ncbi:hypothetical protein [Hoeflea marina]|uniref:hypothetical protein n=1 Tax=Hoeflea marina TaxID=274592 RepID=UPI0011B54F19|nr:hypothetical protein [Hoeflea marina]
MPGYALLLAGCLRLHEIAVDARHRKPFSHNRFRQQRPVGLFPAGLPIAGRLPAGSQHVRDDIGDTLIGKAATCDRSTMRSQSPWRKPTVGALSAVEVPPG